MSTPQAHSPALNSAQLGKMANEFRQRILTILTKAGSGHPGGSLSAIDIITALFYNSARIVDWSRKAMPADIDRDRFIMSKGHGVPALYAVLESVGILSAHDFDTLRELGSKCQGHPDRVRVPEVEVSTGSLGQGLSVAVGYALSYRLKKYDGQIFCMLGDGELQEGQVWEALVCAAHYQLGNLTVILDNNKGQIDGTVNEVMNMGDLANKIKAMNFDYHSIDGHNFDEIIKMTSIRQANKPQFIHAHTLKGKGVSFMENDVVGWHGATPTKEQLSQALNELKAR